MNRLTIRNSDGSVSQPTELRWAEALEKLAAYEDMGLTPEELDNLCRQMSEIRTSLGFKTLDDVYELVSEGRLVALPCKVGDKFISLAKCATNFRFCVIMAENVQTVRRISHLLRSIQYRH